MRYYKPHKGLFILDMICAALISATDLAFPMMTRHMINTIIPGEQLAAVLSYGLLFFVLYGFRCVLEYIVGYYGHMLGVRIEYDMRKEIFSHIHKLSFSYFDKKKKGDLMARVVNDLDEIPEVAHHGPEDFFLSTVRIVGAFILLCTIDLKLTFIVFTIIPFLFWFMLSYNRKLADTFRRFRESLADVNARLEDSISGVKVVQSFTNEAYENAKFDEGNNKFKRIASHSMKLVGIFDSGTNFLANIATLITLVAGGIFVIRGEINIGDMVAFVLYIGMFLQPLQVLQRFVEQYQIGIAGFRRFLEVIETEPEIVDRDNAAELKNAKGKIEFHDVTFGYDDEPPVLMNVNLKVERGETVAIVGSSGAGKTTLCSLIPRFYEIDAGSIKIDDIDIRDIRLSSLRSHIGIVQQDVFLFSGTVRENIAYGRPDASDADIVAAAKAANAHDFIMNLAYGYDTYIGERGAKISGGQKQRLSIARMFLKNPPILIFDEATSSLDNESEAIIQESIANLSRDRTTLIIAHRLATIRGADRIIVLSSDGIVEEGTHEALMASRGMYFHLYHSQFESVPVS